MEWFDDLNLPGSTVTGYFAWVREDGPDEDERPDLELANGAVTFTPTAPAVRTGDSWVGIRPVKARIFNGEIVTDSEDPLPLRILSTDADTGVDNWGWEARFDIDGANIKPIKFRAPASGVHLTGDGLIPITGNPVEVIAGPRGKSAYDYAVEQGYEGTEAEYAAASLPDTVDWSQITNRPSTPTITRTGPGVYTIKEVGA